MRIFLSHSSKDKHIVDQVWDQLGPRVSWLDRADIDLGDIILDKVARAIEEATDFMLFWSKSASESQWVRIELHMAFLRWVEQKGCKLRVVVLDKTALPLYLRPFLYLDVSDSLAQAPSIVVEKLLAEGIRPRRAVRRLFVNRHDELRRLELAVDSPDTHIVLVQGIQGIGKRSLVAKAVEALFSPPEVREIVVRPGTGWVELALQLCAIAGIGAPKEGAPHEEVKSDMRRAVELIHNSGALLAVYEVQRWIGEDGQPFPILAELLRTFASIPAFGERPVFMTSTRVPQLSFEQSKNCQILRIYGIPDGHLSALIRHWLAVEGGKAETDETRLNALASQLYGYPLAARIAASLIANYGIERLLAYPRQVVELRIDIAKDLLAEAKVPSTGVQILEALAVLDAPVPSSYIACALGLTAEAFREGIESVLSFGLLSTEGLALTIHPLIRDFYWRWFSRSPEYREVVAKLAKESKKYLDILELGSEGYARLLPTVFRLFALTGDIRTARQLRRDLAATLLETAIQLYDRREYRLAQRYIQFVLDEWPDEWNARLYKARCLTRVGKTRDAVSILAQMRQERPSSVRVAHELGRAEMEEEKWEPALEWFSQALSNQPNDLPSLRDSAECYLRLKDLRNAEGFVNRAKDIDSRNAFVLNIESQILEERDLLGPAYEAMLIAKAQDPENAAFAHRLGRIAEQRSDPSLALYHYDDALQLDDRFLQARLSKASVLVDMGRRENARQVIEAMRGDVHGSEAAILRGIEAKLLLADDKLDEAKDLIGRNRGAASCGLLARIEMRRAELQRQRGYTALATQSIETAKRYVAQGLSRYPDNKGLLNIHQKLENWAEDS